MRPPGLPTSGSLAGDPGRITALRQAWEEHMETAHDSLPPWYWSRPEREARRDAWVAARLAST